MLAAEAVRQAAGKVIGERLRYAEHDNERKDGGTCGQLEVDLCDCRQNASLHTDHRADKGVDHDQQRELSDVLSQTETDAQTVVSLRDRPRLAARISSIAAGFGGTSASALTNASRFMASIGFHRRSNASVLVGFPLSPAPQTDPEKCPG